MHIADLIRVAQGALEPAADTLCVVGLKLLSFFYGSARRNRLAWDIRDKPRKRLVVFPRVGFPATDLGIAPIQGVIATTCLGLQNYQ